MLINHATGYFEVYLRVNLTSVHGMLYLIECILF